MKIIMSENDRKTLKIVSRYLLLSLLIFLTIGFMNITEARKHERDLIIKKLNGESYCLNKIYNESK